MNSFLQRLAADGTIKPAQPSERIARAYAQKARNALRAANILTEHELYEEATSIAYYATYHQATALLRRAGIKSENHAATIQLLAALYDTDTTTITHAKNERTEKQYRTNEELDPEQTTRLITRAEQFVAQLDQTLDATTDEQAHTIQERFENSLTQA